MLLRGMLRQRLRYWLLLLSASFAKESYYSATLDWPQWTDNPPSWLEQRVTATPTESPSQGGRLTSQLQQVWDSGS